MSPHMKARKHEKPVARDQTPTAFGSILARLLRHSPGVRAAALIDPEGETVDYAGELPDYFTKLVSAHFRIVIDDVVARFARGQLGTPYQVIVRAKAWSFAARRLPEGYALVIIFQRHAFTLSERALAVCDDELSREADWPTAPRPPGSWFAVEVQPSPRDRRRPGRVRLGSRWYPVDILGHMVGLPHERGYRCRVSSGAELTLIREASGQWFSDELIPVHNEAATGQGGPLSSPRSPGGRGARAASTRKTAANTPLAKKK